MEKVKGPFQRDGIDLARAARLVVCLIFWVLHRSGRYGTATAGPVRPEGPATDRARERTRRRSLSPPAPLIDFWLRAVSEKFGGFLGREDHRQIKGNRNTRPPWSPCARGGAGLSVIHREVSFVFEGCDGHSGRTCED